jgi:hypothetical protein
MNYLYIFIDNSKQGELRSPWTPPFWETHGSRCHYVASRSVAPPVLSPYDPSYEGAIDEQPEVAPRVTSFGSYTLLLCLTD